MNVARMLVNFESKYMNIKIVQKNVSSEDMKERTGKIKVKDIFIIRDEV
jgi:hypothetical protein